MNYIWDLIAVVIIAISIYIGVKRGFVRTIVTFLCYGISLIAARNFSPLLAQRMYDGYFSERITTAIAGQIGIALESGAVTGANVLGALPELVSSVIKGLYPEFEELSVNLLKQVISPEFIDTTARQLSESVSGIIVEFMGWFVFIIIFLLGVTILKWIAKLFTGVNQIPIVGQINMALGGITGALIGIIVIILLMLVVEFLSTVLGIDFPSLQLKTMESSFIMGTLRRLFV